MGVADPPTADSGSILARIFSFPYSSRFYSFEIAPVLLSPTTSLSLTWSAIFFFRSAPPTTSEINPTRLILIDLKLASQFRLASAESIVLDRRRPCSRKSAFFRRCDDHSLGMTLARCHFVFFLLLFLLISAVFKGLSSRKGQSYDFVIRFI